MKNYLIFTIFLTFSISAFSQDWLPAGNVVDPGIRPSISTTNNNIAWIANGETNNPKIFRTTNGGVNWMVIPTAGITKEIYCIWGMDANTAFVGEGVVSGNAKMLKTTNGGLNWTTVLTTGSNSGHFTGIVFTKGIGNLFGVAMAEKVYRSSDAGANWVELNAAVVGVSNAQNSLMIVDNNFYGFGLNNGAARVRLTTNNSVSWNTQAISVIGSYTSAIAFHSNKLLGVAATSTSLPMISRTTDGGLSWKSIDVGAGISGTCYLTWVPYTPVVYILGGNGVIKRSTDNGVNWVTTPTPGVTNLTHFDFFHSGNVVYGYAVSSNGNVIKLADTLGILTGISSHNNIPDEYSLSQNYPNPFNPVTNIKYSIPVNSFVKLSVFDVLGREVSTPVNEYKHAGNYELSFSSDELGSGVYYYRIEAANFTDTKKMILIK
jgi:photosystem II stability/assembly factor-like uncharacterized protein